MSAQAHTRLAIEFISVLGMPPPQFAALADGLGVRHISLAPAPITANPHGFAGWNLLTEPALVRETRQALARHDVSVSDGEGFLILPGREMAEAAHALDVMAELGAPVVNCNVLDQDRSRACDEFALFAGLAAERGMTAVLEFLPITWPATLAEAAMFIGDSGATNGRLLIDSMHLFRSGGTVADLAAIDPALIGYIQLCDAPLPALTADYGEEARHNRLPPGEGDLPLAAFLAALPKELIVGLELPMLAKAEAGIDTAARLAPAITTAREMLAASG